MNDERGHGCRTCLKCGWVAFGVSRKYAELEVEKFNEYYNKLTPFEQTEYYGGKPSTIRQYEHCMVCDNSYTEFRDAVAGDCPNGVTLSPIIVENGIERANKVLKDAS